MQLLGNNVEKILDEKIIIEMSIGEFMHLYITHMICNSNEFEEDIRDTFDFLSEDDAKYLFCNLKGRDMENIIDKLNIQHKKWL